MGTKRHKIWETDSVHPTFQAADARRNALKEKLEGEKEVKIRKRTRGYMVKVWNGLTEEVPEGPKLVVAQKETQS